MVRLFSRLLISVGVLLIAASLLLVPDADVGATESLPDACDVIGGGCDGATDPCSGIGDILKCKSDGKCNSTAVPSYCKDCKCQPVSGDCACSG